MADPQDSTPNPTTAAGTGTALSSATARADVHPDSEPDVTTPSSPASPDPEVLNKIRADEKAKHQKSIAKAEAEAKKASDALVAERIEREKLESELARIRKSALSPDEQARTEMAERDAKIKRLEDETKAAKVAAEAAHMESEAQLKAYKLEMFRQKKISEQGIRLHELVTGDTEEEILAAVDRAKQREVEITRQESDRVRAEAAKHVPTPTAPPSAPMPGVAGMSRRDYARLPDAEFEKLRREQLRQARIALGIPV